MSRDKNILISGCSSGIGLHCAQALVRRGGWRVFASARKPDDVERLREQGFAAVRLDLDDPGSIREAVAEVAAATGNRLDALFNNAGFGQPGAVEDLTREALRAQFETNLFGTQELSNAAVRLMRAGGGGRIIYNSSLLGYVSLPWRGAYNASKHALEALADTMRLELRGSGVHVVLIEPGPITSRFRANAVPHFRRHINADASPHRETYRRMEKSWSRGDEMTFTLGPEAVFKALLHALESRRPRPRYRVTVPSVALWWLKRLLSTRALDRMMAMSSKRAGD